MTYIKAQYVADLLSNLEDFGIKPDALSNERLEASYALTGGMPDRNDAAMAASFISSQVNLKETTK